MRSPPACSSVSATTRVEATVCARHHLWAFDRAAAAGDPGRRVVLLIACATWPPCCSRAPPPFPELAIRASLGPPLRSPAALRRKPLLSSLRRGSGLLSTFGVRYIAKAFGRNVPYWMSFPIDAQVLGVVALLCVLSTVLFGLAPALTFSKTTPGGAMKEGGGSGRALRAWTQALLVGELSLTVVMLAGSGLLLRSFLVLYRRP